MLITLTSLMLSAASLAFLLRSIYGKERKSEGAKKLFLRHGVKSMRQLDKLRFYRIRIFAGEFTVYRNDIHQIIKIISHECEELQ